MNEATYVNSKSVKDFIDWLSERFYAKGLFSHSYITGRPKMSWSCDSIYSAYQNYNWSFNFTDEQGYQVSGSSFDENTYVLKGLSRQLNDSIDKSDNEKCLVVCSNVMKWGGTNHPSNQRKLLELSNISNYLRTAKTVLDANKDLDWYCKHGLYIGGGFSKIYSLLANNFVIYDSRVGSALCALVRDYCAEKAIVEIPDSLKFAYGLKRGSSSKNNPRNPNTGIYKFPPLASHNYLQMNIKANWLLKETIMRDSGNFGVLGKKDGLRALEAALFMLGYKVWIND